MVSFLYEPFKNWISAGSIFILSDTHFDDPECKRLDENWISATEQVRLINETVSVRDTFVCLGDVGNPEYVEKLRTGRKILLLGNHDEKEKVAGYFDEVYDGPLLISDRIMLSHEPVYGLPWCLNIHGHNHSVIQSYKDGCPHLHLAANVCGYTPVNLEKLIEEGILDGIHGIHATEA